MLQPRSLAFNFSPYLHPTLPTISLCCPLSGAPWLRERGFTPFHLKSPRYSLVCNPHLTLTDPSLPSLPHPFLSPRPVPMSSNPSPASPNESPRLPSHSTLPHSIYHSLQNGLIAGATIPASYQSTQSTYRQSPPRTASPRIDEKSGAGFTMASSSTVRDREGSPRLWGVELKWISCVELSP